MDYLLKFKNINKEQIFSVLIVLMIIGDVYVVPFLPIIGWGELVLMCLLPFFIFSKKTFTVIRNDRLYYIFLLYSILVSLLNVAILDFSSRDIIARLAREFFYFTLIFIVGNGYFKYDTFCESLKKVSIILSFFIICQVIVYYSIGFFIPGLVMDWTIKDGGYTGEMMYDGLLLYANIEGYLKPNGFLCEPSHCAGMLAICLICLLYDNKHCNNLSYPIIVSIAMICTMSTTAFILISIIWLYWIYINFKNNPILTLVFIVITFLFVLYLFQYEIIYHIESALYRLFHIFTNDAIETSSSYLRLLKGFYEWNYLPFVQKIFGIGFGGFDSAFRLGMFQGYVSSYTEEYMNSVSYLLMSAGLIGSVLYWWYFLSLFSKKNSMIRILLITIIVLSLGWTVYSTVYYVWIMLLLRDCIKKSIS